MSVASVVFEGFGSSGIASVVLGGFSVVSEEQTETTYTHAPIYDQAYETALSLLTSFGQPIILRRLSETFDPASGMLVETGSVDGTVMGVITSMPQSWQGGGSSGISIGETNQFSDRGIPLAIGERMVIIDGTIAPLMTDVVVIRGDEWRIVGIETVNPGGLAIVYKLAVKR